MRFALLTRARVLDAALTFMTFLAASALPLVSGCSCGPAPTGCTPGTSSACTCTDGRSGAQVCLSSGTYGACVCEGVDAGTGDGGGLDAPGLDAPGADVPSFRDTPPGDSGPPLCVRDVDWLLMVDTSNSMIEEQATLASEIPAMVTALITGDVDGDGTPELEPVRSLHFGVITPDMGSGPVTVVTCDPGHGDDGILRATSAGAGCPPTYPDGIFDFVVGAGDATAFAATAACVSQAGTGGCGFEQQLEATLKAVSPGAATAWTRAGYVPPVFHGPSSGNGDGANDGFVRDGSLLAITLFTDEEDCSVPDYALFDPTEPRFAGIDLNLRCFMSPAELYPVSRYVEGILQLRDDPRTLVFGVIAGVPTDLVGLDTPARYDAILADPRMVEMLDTSMMPPSRLSPSCTSTSGSAMPPRRMVTVARDLALAGAYTRVGSICASSYRSDLSAIVRAIADGAPSCM